MTYKGSSVMAAWMDYVSMLCRTDGALSAERARPAGKINAAAMPDDIPG